MLLSVFLALFLPCAGMSAVFLVYICLLCYSSSGVAEEIPAVEAKRRPEGGLSASDLEKLPRVAGKDLILGADCAVCLDEIGREEAARLIPGCNHGFHLECVDSWLAKNSICPICRGKIVHEMLSPPEPDPC